MEVNGGGLWDKGGVADDAAQAKVESSVEFLGEVSAVYEFAVLWHEGSGDLTSVTEGQLQIFSELFLTWVGGVGNGVHVSVNEAGDLFATFTEQFTGDLVQDWALWHGLEDLVDSDHTETIWLLRVHEDWHKDTEDRLWDEFTELTESGNGFNADQQVFTFFGFLDDLFEEFD